MTEIITNKQKRDREAVRAQEIKLIGKQLVLLLGMEEASDIIDEIKIARGQYSTYLVLDRFGLKEKDTDTSGSLSPSAYCEYKPEEIDEGEYTAQFLVERYELTVEQVVAVQKKLCGI